MLHIFGLVLALLCNFNFYLILFQLVILVDYLISGNIVKNIYLV